MLYECTNNEADFLNRLAYINSFVEELGTSCVFIVGDLNSDISDPQSAFSNHLQQYCRDSDLILSSKVLLPTNSFTYVSDAWNTTSWLDHCISTSDAHQSIDSMDIMHNMVISDHAPIIITVNMHNIPILSSDNNDLGKGRLDWTNLSEADINNYCTSTELLLGSIALPHDALLCRNANCNNDVHKRGLCTMYDNIVQSLNSASEPLYKCKNRVHNIKPGWNEHVAELHTAAREAYLMWIESGKNRQGPLFELKKRTNARFKYALRFIKQNEAGMRADSLARKMQKHDSNDFWKEVRIMNNCKIPLPTNIDGITGLDKIAELWRKHYNDLFNCLKSSMCCISNVDFTEQMVIKPDEIQEAIKKLEDNKSCGLDNINAEHLKNASQKLIPLLALCITGFLVHGVLPDSMISVLLVPVIKNKSGKINSKDNYRPIALACILSKVLEIILLDRLELYMLTNDNQFGFKKKHGTDMCIFALKEIIASYRNLNSSMFLCFLDASKAFDRINHEKLFRKMRTEVFLCTLLEYLYIGMPIKQ